MSLYQSLNKDNVLLIELKAMIDLSESTSSLHCSQRTQLVQPSMQDTMFLFEQSVHGKWDYLQKFLLFSWDQTLYQWFENVYISETTTKQNHSSCSSAEKTSPALPSYSWYFIRGEEFLLLLPAKISCSLIIYLQNNSSCLCFRYIFPRRLNIFNDSTAIRQCNLQLNRKKC